LRGREEIAQLTARLRSEHEEYESASQSWSPEAEEKKRELRKARADTLVEIGAALAWLGGVERLQEIERLPFEQKLARLEAFLEDPQGGSGAPSQGGNTPPDAIPHAVAEPPVARPELEATQEAPRAEQKLAQLEAFIEDTQGGSAAPSQEGNTPPDALDVAVDDIDAGWDDEEAEPEPEWRALTPEEREVRAARAAARREKLRAKATEKVERRKARASIAKGKQKQKQKIRRPRNEPEPRRPSQSQAGEPVANESPREGETLRAPSRRNDPRVLAFLVAIVLVVGGVALFLWRR
jgi:hypothetical protein